MRLLLDTHALVWWSEDHPRMGRAARAALLLDGNTVFVSAISIYEMTLKHRFGKWPEVAHLVATLDDFLASQRFATLPLDAAHAAMAGNLPPDHRDPFDRMLIAQALTEDLTLVSNETLFDRFGVRRLW